MSRTSSKFWAQVFASSSYSSCFAILFEERVQQKRFQGMEVVRWIICAGVRQLQLTHISYQHSKQGKQGSEIRPKPSPGDWLLSCLTEVTF